jgi:hypothetical protein
LAEAADVGFLPTIDSAVVGETRANETPKPIPATLMVEDIA